jgi:hypothetical protein
MAKCDLCASKIGFFGAKLRVKYNSGFRVVCRSCFAMLESTHVPHFADRTCASVRVCRFVAAYALILAIFVGGMAAIGLTQCGADAAEDDNSRNNKNNSSSSINNSNINNSINTSHSRRLIFSKTFTIRSIALCRCRAVATFDRLKRRCARSLTTRFFNEHRAVVWCLSNVQRGA